MKEELKTSNLLTKVFINEKLDSFISLIESESSTDKISFSAGMFCAELSLITEISGTEISIPDQMNITYIEDEITRYFMETALINKEELINLLNSLKLD